ncbi:hypothetical protein [Nocardia sp. CNY236]|uniref:hypothetical protein n=1 Tax=Nocardia sp. CNY236 TaxID=1169152 RepID=UPI001E42693E|nr:hypothetical protein [Nocardia sp. CNY236]
MRVSLGVILVLGLAMLSVGCGRDDLVDKGSEGDRATVTTRLLEDVPAPDPGTPDGVAVAALQQIYSWRPAVESRGASLVRARNFLGPSLLRLLEAPPAEVDLPKPSLQWADWAEEGARVEAFTFASGEKAPNPTDPNVRQFKIGIEQTVVHPNGRRQPLPPATVIATVVRTPDGWRLDAFR